MTTPRVGLSLGSVVDTTTITIVRAPAGAGDVSITCGGVEMREAKTITDADRTATLSDDEQEPTLMGKRYVNPAGDLEVLCTKPGKGRLAVDGTPLAIKEAKPLPASD